jgi:16S rRNA (cytosine967-C5)-methyltransferase
LVAGVSRGRGSYDAIISAAAGRSLRDFQPAVLVVLRMLAHQALAMRVREHAAVATSVELASTQIGGRVKGLVNAVGRRLCERDLDAWMEMLSQGRDSLDQLALRTMHPRWIAAVYARLLPEDELEPALRANNYPPPTTLALRPGLAEFTELPDDAEPARYSPFGAYVGGDPGRIPAVAEGRAGVQDEGSQLVALALSRVDAAPGRWLDACAGPGGKAALLAGLALQDESQVLASELHHHRAELVAENLRNYSTASTVQADATRPPWTPGTFCRVLADVPCTGLGALRRRPDARWRRAESDLETLVPLQTALLNSALDAAAPGGVVAYVTCSPHPLETTGVIASLSRADFQSLHAAEYLPEVPDAETGDFVQLWPHRHRTDAMFLALLRKR